ncbi:MULTISPECIES: molybdopterin-dependent oxidoreductase [Rhodomicrobium]|uniref:molybdopterin-dependent oxidoreductase n=1 Tax=Rhodomicrobium TaxID=1068 RepID=UPI000B4BF2E5|nr:MULTISPECIES: molybdopterin-dependent oxidoreductase [Rhodomicrobium]
MAQNLNRRALLKMAGGLGAALLTGCDQLTQDQTVRRILGAANPVDQTVQRALGPNALAAEFDEADLSPKFRPNGSTDPDNAAYQAAAGQGFSDWRLNVTGLVGRPAQFSLADLRALPSRTQITRHDCVEGWSCIGKWSGTRLSALLEKTDLKPTARYIVFHCADALPSGDFSPPVPYYESIDLNDAWHEQTILAYEMNGQDLPVAHGAPLRLRVERQLGYKHAKYVMAIEAVESFANIGGGNGSYWADNGYSWYAGI